MATYNYRTIKNIIADLSKNVVPIYAHSPSEKEAIFDKLKTFDNLLTWKLLYRKATSGKKFTVSALVMLGRASVVHPSLWTWRMTVGITMKAKAMMKK